MPSDLPRIPLPLQLSAEHLAEVEYVADKAIALAIEARTFNERREWARWFVIASILRWTNSWVNAWMERNSTDQVPREMWIEDRGDRLIVASDGKPEQVWRFRLLGGRFTLDSKFVGPGAPRGAITRVGFLSPGFKTDA